VIPSGAIDTGVVAAGGPPLLQVGATLDAVEAQVRGLAGISGACGQAGLAGAVDGFAARWGAELARLGHVCDDLAARLQLLTASYDAAERGGQAMFGPR
jgi:hypothetical protein